jgi:hypothetical protein
MTSPHANQHVCFRRAMLFQELARFDRSLDTAICPELRANQKCRVHARSDAIDPTRTFLQKPALAPLCSLKTFRKNLQNSGTESPRRATKDLAVSLVELKRRQSVRAFARSMGRADTLKMGVAALQFWSVNSHLG